MSRSDQVVPAIDIVDVTKSYSALRVLDGVTLAVNPGEVMCLIGPSGSGKSTLLRLINHLDTFEGGDIKLWGYSIREDRVNVNRLRQRVGMVFQAYNLFPHLTAMENVALAPMKCLGMPRAQAMQQAQALLDRFNLGPKASEYPDRLSGGQQQRVAIVRSLAMKPRALLLDEVTSALDPQLVGEVLSLLTELAHDGMTMILATHEMRFAADVAHRVAFLDGGRVVEIGPPDQIFRAPKEARTREFLMRTVGQGNDRGV